MKLFFVTFKFYSTITIINDTKSNTIYFILMNYGCKRNSENINRINKLNYKLLFINC